MRIALIAFVLLSLSLSAAARETAPKASISRLDQVLEQGYVRVCTTGDYKPFTYLNPDTQAFEGIDIDMAKSLGAALEVEVRFVKTSWPTLMEDFTSDKCDIAMGGISVNLGRQKQAFFSIAYLTDGKAPIARCEDVDKYQTIEQIDRPEVRVIVNPGGTNEKFARAHLAKAQLTVYDDNVTIFDQILKGEADVMVTDAVETKLQQKLRPGLCAVHPDAPFTYSEKGYLLPRGDMVLKEWVDQWLHLALASGEFGKVLGKWLE